MKYIGAHVSASKGVQNAPLNAHEIGAKAFAMFTKNQRQWHAKPLEYQVIANFKENCSKHGFSSKYIMPHDSYLINLGHPQKDALEKSRAAFLDEVERCELLGLDYLNFHPGNALNTITSKECLEIIAESINITIEKTRNLILAIETTAGMGSSVGSSFKELAQIIEKIQNKSRVGVCIDTCHIFAAGYDISTKMKYEDTMKRFEDEIGIDYLKGAHLNDSKKNVAAELIDMLLLVKVSSA